MAVKNTAARPGTTKGRRAKPQSRRPSLWRLAVRLLLGGAGFARPRTAAQVLALLLTLFALATAGIEVYTGIAHRSAPGVEVAWPGVLLVAALAARLYPHWWAEFQAMTADRARNYVGSTLIVLVALAATGHVIGQQLGLWSGYPLLGPMSTGRAAYVAMGMVVAVALALILKLPLGRWMASMARGAVGVGSRAGTVVASASERSTVDAAAFDPLPYQPYTTDEMLDEPEVHGIFRLQQEEVQAPTPRKAVQPEFNFPVDNGPLLPPIEVFVASPKGEVAAIDVEYKSQRIVETLQSFNVAARVVDSHVGPVVTQFDIQPERGVKVKSITALQNDLALALAAPTIRIQAPVPGKAVVGIEIPNTAAQMVSLRDLLESEKYRSMQSPLKVVLGKDVAGSPAVIDLAKMPHLLIAGATGSGKSVCVNALISSLLYNNTPEQVRLMMIDPKKVELTVYNGVPHLLSPVVTHMDKVVGMLQWAIREMDRRYQIFADATSRNIGRYNEKMEAAGQEKLPYIVIVIDELADLMMAAPEDVEDAICRLAQLARACGIHLVIATQRPSVDVVTGLIKANFPARIAFQMSSQIDSRTILDSVGAEKLLGRGDMLYQPPDAPKPVRLQGANVTDGEIERLVEFWHRSPLQQAIQRIADAEFEAAEKAASDAGDELLSDAMRVVREYQHASVSLLQRRLKIGYSRAARIMDQLEERQIVGPADGSKQRSVLDYGDDGESGDD